MPQRRRAQKSYRTRDDGQTAEETDREQKKLLEQAKRSKGQNAALSALPGEGRDESIETLIDQLPLGPRQIFEALQAIATDIHGGNRHVPDEISAENMPGDQLMVNTIREINKKCFQQGEGGVGFSYLPRDKQDSIRRDLINTAAELHAHGLQPHMAHNAYSALSSASSSLQQDQNELDQHKVEAMAAPSPSEIAKQGQALTLEALMAHTGEVELKQDIDAASQTASQTSHTLSMPGGAPTTVAGSVASDMQQTAVVGAHDIARLEDTYAELGAVGQQLTQHTAAVSTLVTNLERIRERNADADVDITEARQQFAQEKARKLQELIETIRQSDGMTEEQKKELWNIQQENAEAATQQGMQEQAEKEKALKAEWVEKQEQKKIELADLVTRQKVFEIRVQSKEMQAQSEIDQAEAKTRESMAQHEEMSKQQAHQFKKCQRLMEKVPDCPVTLEAPKQQAADVRALTQLHYTDIFKKLDVARRVQEQRLVMHNASVEKMEEKMLEEEVMEMDEQLGHAKQQALVAAQRQQAAIDSAKAVILQKQQSEHHQQQFVQACQEQYKAVYQPEVKYDHSQVQPLHQMVQARLVPQTAHLQLPPPGVAAAAPQPIFYQPPPQTPSPSPSPLQEPKPDVPPTLHALASQIVNALMATQEISPLDQKGRDVLRALLMKEAEEQVGKGHDEHSMSTHLWGIARNELYTRWPETYVAGSLADAPSILSGSASNSTGFGGSAVMVDHVYESQTGFTRDKKVIVGGQNASDSDSNSDAPEHEILSVKDTIAKTIRRLKEQGEFSDDQQQRLIKLVNSAIETHGAYELKKSIKDALLHMEKYPVELTFEEKIAEAQSSGASAAKIQSMRTLHLLDILSGDDETLAGGGGGGGGGGGATVAAKPASKPSGAQPKPSAKVAAGAGDDPPPGGPNAPPNVALPGHPVVPISQQTGVAIARGEPDPDGGGGGENAQNPLLPAAHPMDQDAADENDEMDDDAPPPMGPLAMVMPWHVEHVKDGGYVPKWMPLGPLYHQEIYKTMDPQKYCKDTSWLSYLGLQKPKNWQGH